MRTFSNDNGFSIPQNGILSGLDSLDAQLGGLYPGELSILAGRTGMGKTALALGWAIAAAKAGHAVLFFTLETSTAQLALRVAAIEAGVAAAKIRISLNKEEYDALSMASERLRSIPLHISDTPGLSIDGIRREALQLHRHVPIKMIVVDYIDLAVNRDPQEDKEYQAGLVIKGLKQLAKEMNIPVLGVSQLSRKINDRKDKRPTLSDIETKSIEDDSDVLMLLYRHEYYLNNEEPIIKNEHESDKEYISRYNKWSTSLEESSGKAVISIAKNRHGPLGKASVAFDTSIIKFHNL